MFCEKSVTVFRLWQAIWQSVATRQHVASLATNPQKVEIVECGLQRSTVATVEHRCGVRLLPRRL